MRLTPSSFIDLQPKQTQTFPLKGPADKTKQALFPSHPSPAPQSLPHEWLARNRTLWPQNQLATETNTSCFCLSDRGFSCLGSLLAVVWYLQVWVLSAWSKSILSLVRVLPLTFLAWLECLPIWKSLGQQCKNERVKTILNFCGGYRTVDPPLGHSFENRKCFQDVRHRGRCTPHGYPCLHLRGLHTCSNPDERPCTRACVLGKGRGHHSWVLPTPGCSTGSTVSRGAEELAPKVRRVSVCGRGWKSYPGPIFPHYTRKGRGGGHQHLEAAISVSIAPGAAGWLWARWIFIQRCLLWNSLALLFC